LIVTAPPAEGDDLRPDTDTLARLARDSGGQVWALADLEKLAASLWQRDTAAVSGKPVWESAWPRGWVAILITLLFGAEWWIRRREGLL
jgi:hypothetical protein